VPPRKRYMNPEALRAWLATFSPTEGLNDVPVPASLVPLYTPV
jgi:hypothetical protein